MRPIAPPPEVSTPRAILQANRPRIEFFLKRTAFADLLPNEAHEAAELLMGIGAAIEQALGDRARSVRPDPGDAGTTGGLLAHLSNLAQED
jgi:hypothetical protein